MKKKNRICKNAEFKKIIHKHQIQKSNVFVIYTDKNKLGYTRVGISVSSKLGNAVTRNRIKRQIRALVHDLVNLDNNIDIVIIAKEDFKKNSYHSNCDSLKQLLEKL